MGFEVIKALKFQSGFTHMEWYRKADGEVVFGEIGARLPDRLDESTRRALTYARDDSNDPDLRRGAARALERLR